MELSDQWYFALGLGFLAATPQIGVTVRRKRTAAFRRSLLSIMIKRLDLAIGWRLTGENPVSLMSANTRLTTGIAGLDDLLGGGLLPGTLTVVVGSTGIGKTQFGLQFARAGMQKEGTPGIIFDMTARGDSQNHADYARRMFGWDPTTADPDAHVELSGFFAADARGKSACTMLANANTIIHLGKIREGTRFRRAMYVSKHRGSVCPDEIIPYTIDDRGISLERCV